MVTPVRILPAIQIPELGPSLGRVALAPDASSAHPIALDDIRLDLATAIFELTEDAGAWSATGDRTGAVEALGRAAWLTGWEAAVRAVAERLAAAVDARIAAAAAESRIPGRRRKSLQLSAAERRALHARLGGGSLALSAGLDGLERAAHQVRDTGVLDRDAFDRWRGALTEAARRLETAWLELESVVDLEWHRWTPLVESARRWRRPRWALWTFSLLVAGLAVYVGLVVGGYLPGPPFLYEFARWWWNSWDRLITPV
ncbi:MAG: hypothetical protein ABI836_16485 [Gemmatimonadota bacterium]